MSKKISMKMRHAIISILIIIMGSVIVTMLSLQYYFSKELAFDATHKYFEQVSKSLENRTEFVDKNTSNILSMFKLYKTTLDIPRKNKRHLLVKLLTNTLSNNDYIYSMYVGNQDGDFYEVIKFDIDKKLRKKYKATKEAKWLIIKIYTENNVRVRYEEHLNENLKQIASFKKEAIYDPTTRDWYKDAIKYENVKTKPYIFSSINEKGVTYAKKAPTSNSVIGIDVLLNNVKFNNKDDTNLNKSKIILFKKNREIVYSTNFNKYDMKNTEYEKVFSLTQKNINKINFLISIDNKDYFAFFTKLDSIYGNSDYLSILTPVETIMEPYTKKIYNSFFITILILTFTIPLIWFATKVLIKPINDLSKENKKILNRKFNEIKIIDTNIRELFDLSSSFVNMAKSIKKYEDKQRELMDSFIKLIASAIDAKSRYTGKHCERVPVLTMLIAQEASLAKDGIFKDFSIDSEEKKRELSIASWLHDCGKVIIPEYVMDKATKLETIYNRIHEIRMRFEVIHRDLTIKMYKNILNKKDKKEQEELLKKEHQKLFEDFEIIAKANIGSEFVGDDEINKIKHISKRTWTRYFDNTIGLSQEEQKRSIYVQTPAKENLLDDKKEHIIKREEDLTPLYKKYNFNIEIPKNLYNLGEIYNLSINKGTLTKEERFKINEHIMMSIIMLEQLPFPKNLKKIPEYAGAHHETLIGTGYPRKLKKEDMSIPARIMTIADIFEALTAADRPYKKAKMLSESINILSLMAKDKHIDADIFKLFLKTGIYKKYANKYLNKSQIDEIDINKYL